jgi:hypothetical protein
VSMSLILLSRCPRAPVTPYAGRNTGQAPAVPRFSTALDYKGARKG